jgi:hypothetical protein
MLKTALLALVLALPALAAEPSVAEAQRLWQAWPGVRVSAADPWALKHAGLRSALAELQTRHPGLFTIAEEGRSAEGRQIPLLRVGQGPAGVLLWSQMHGDEPTATLALLDLLNWLGGHRADPETRRLLANLTLWIIPMLNPDGAERSQRWNAQEIDINRDALRLSSPEGRFLKAVRDRTRPVLGYNLHNQSPTVTAGKGGEQVAISLLSVPGDEALSDTEGTRRTRRLAVQVQRLVSALAGARVSRYDMDYTERAFGDSMTRWGTPTLLIETGGWAGPQEAEQLVRLNFVALLGSLSALAGGAVDRLDVQDYDRIPLNQRNALATLVVRNARLAGGRGLPPFLADLSFLVPGKFAGDSPRRREPAVLEVGDLAHVQGSTELDASGMLAVPWPGTEAWPTLRETLQQRGLVSTDEARLLALARGFGEAAVARIGFRGALLLYRSGAGGTMTLAGAVVAGQLQGGDPLTSKASAGASGAQALREVS